jgi:hypothetical protein
MLNIQRADAGGEGGVIFNSAISLLQGLFPGSSDYATTLANGTTVEGPLSGYQVCSRICCICAAKELNVL